jgi:hypothetical protein
MLTVFMGTSCDAGRGTSRAPHDAPPDGRGQDEASGGEGHLERAQRHHEPHGPPADLVQPEQEDREAAGDAERPGEGAAPQ